MNCYQCGSELIWGGDHSFEDCGLEGEGVVQNFSCPDCPTFVLSHSAVDMSDVKPLTEEYSEEGDRWASGYRIGYWQMRNFYRPKLEALERERDRYKEMAQR